MSYTTTQKKGYTIQDLKKDMMSNDTHRHRRQLDAQGADLSVVQVQVREVHRQLILNHIRKQGPTPQFTIARLTGLSRTTVSNIISDLKRDGWIYEGDQLEVTEKGGRKPTLIHFKADSGYVIGVDIGRSHLTILLTDLEAKKIDQWSGPFDTNLGGKVCLQLLVDELQKFLTANQVKWEKVIGIGLGVPGTLDPQLRRLTKPALMPAWEEIDIPQYLQRKFKTSVYLDNDANLGALGENRYGAGQGVANLLYVKIGTGIGAGLILDGHLYRGSRGAAGEIGHMKVSELDHMKVSEGDSRCENCRNYGCTYGCLESLAAEPAILEDTSQGSLLLGTHAPLPAHTDDDQVLAIARVVRAAQHGDEVSRAVIERAGKRIGVMLGGIINLLNPEKILLDGGVVRAAGDLLLTPIRQNADASSLPAMKGTPILPGELGKDAIAQGAVATVIDAIDIAFTQNKATQALVVTNKR